MRRLLVLSVAFFLGCDDSHVEGPGDGPSIVSVTWEHAAGCVQNTAGTVTITVTAVDPNDATASLIVAGSVTDCTGNVAAFTSMVTCPNAAAVTGQVQVSDPEPHTDSAFFTIEPCVNGMVMPE